ncbi:MAG: tripartite tricarboxylate transporter substrate binding protein [Betaproteobacteria bacterium]|nr:tripartite tricarboxylate transporter substrate binding protein [Betaproteobacteria bacterium]
MTDGLAQSYPTRPIRLIAPFAPGGGVDLIARLLGAGLGRSDSLGQTVVVDNRAGAGGAIGAEIAARAEPDGYTLLLGNSTTHGVNQAYFRLPYDSVRDFTPITLVASAPLVLATAGALPVKSVKEFIALAKARPGQLNYGSAGRGSVTHLTMELFKVVTGVNVVHIPYKGVGPAFTAMMTGEIQCIIVAVTASMSHVRAGRIKALGITGVRHSRLLPDVPTLAEQGVAGFDADYWYGLLGPARMPRRIVARLNQEALRIIGGAEFKQKMIAQGVEPTGSAPEEFEKIVRGEVAKWARLVKDAGIQEQ